MKTVGIIIPTAWEAGPVIKNFRMQAKAKDLFCANVREKIVWVRVSGVGREKARQAVDRLWKEKGIHMLVSAGFCGALVPGLNVGDVLHDRIVTVDTPIKTPTERTALTQRANALGVDMETQAIIEAGTLRGIPIRIIRVISDRFDDNLSPLFGSDSEFSTARILARLLTTPSAWPLALRLRRQSQIASRVLAQALEKWLENPR